MQQVLGRVSAVQRHTQLGYAASSRLLSKMAAATHLSVLETQQGEASSSKIPTFVDWLSVTLSLDAQSGLGHCHMACRCKGCVRASGSSYSIDWECFQATLMQEQHEAMLAFHCSSPDCITVNRPCKGRASRASHAKQPFKPVEHYHVCQADSVGRLFMSFVGLPTSQ